MIQATPTKKCPISDCDFFWDIEHMTFQDGYIKWKGTDVEHFSLILATSEAGYKTALEIEARCKFLERNKIKVCTRNTVWEWDKIIAGKRRHEVVVKFMNGQFITTEINGTKESIEAYYKVGSKFNVGSGRHDRITTVHSVIFLTDNVEVK